LLEEDSLAGHEPFLAVIHPNALSLVRIDATTLVAVAFALEVVLFTVAPSFGIREARATRF
jgi:hypothetical protein